MRSLGQWHGIFRIQISDQKKDVVRRKDGEIIPSGIYILKLIHQRYGSPEGERLDNEKKILRKIWSTSKPANVIKMYGSWSVDRYGRDMYNHPVKKRYQLQLMEYLEKDLAKHLYEKAGYLAEHLCSLPLDFQPTGKSPFSLEWIVKVYLDVAKGLTEVHAEMIKYNDIKAQNMCVIEKEGIPTVKLIDFGLSSFKSESWGTGYLKEAQKAVILPLLSLIECTLKSRSLLPMKVCDGNIPEHKKKGDCSGTCSWTNYRRSFDKGEAMLKIITTNYPTTEESRKIWRELVIEDDQFSSRYFRDLYKKDEKVLYKEGAKQVRDHLQILYDTLTAQKHTKKC